MAGLPQCAAEAVKVHYTRPLRVESRPHDAAQQRLTGWALGSWSLYRGMRQAGGGEAKGGHDVCHRSYSRPLGIGRAVIGGKAARLSDDQHEPAILDRGFGALVPGLVLASWL